METNGIAKVALLAIQKPLCWEAGLKCQDVGDASIVLRSDKVNGNVNVITPWATDSYANLIT
jgi:hypothetical protein